MLRIPHCLDNRLIDGDKVVSPTHPMHSTPQKHYYFYVSANHFCYCLSKPQGLVRSKGLGKCNNSPNTVSNPATFIFYRGDMLPIAVKIIKGSMALVRE
jgi:hypothetical protein